MRMIALVCSFVMIPVRLVVLMIYYKLSRDYCYMARKTAKELLEMAEKNRSTHFAR